MEKPRARPKGSMPWPVSSGFCRGGWAPKSSLLTSLRLSLSHSPGRLPPEESAPLPEPGPGSLRDVLRDLQREGSGREPSVHAAGP